MLPYSATSQYCCCGVNILLLWAAARSHTRPPLTRLSEAGLLDPIDGRPAALPHSPAALRDRVRPVSGPGASRVRVPGMCLLPQRTSASSTSLNASPFSLTA